jgi:hypothetical protein
MIRFLLHKKVDVQFAIQKQQRLNGMVGSAWITIMRPEKFAVYCVLHAIEELDCCRITPKYWMLEQLICGAEKPGIAEGKNEKGNLPAKLLVKFPG